MRDAPLYYLAYVENYDTVNKSQTLAGSFLQKSHYLLEKTLPKDMNYLNVLEVGAGTGHHLPYVKCDFNRYVMTDGSDEMLKIASEKYAEQISKDSVIIENQNAGALTYSDNSFDRLIATHVLEHLPDPVQILKEWDRVVRPQGVISIVLPCDPGILWRLGRHFGPRRNMQKMSVDYDYLQAAEHINPIFNLVVFIRYHFDNVSELWYPARVPVPDLNLFYVCHIKT